MSSPQNYNTMKPSNPPFIFFGTPYVAKDTLALLVLHGFTPSLVVTSPDAKSGRGMQLTPCDTKRWALEHILPVYTPEKITPEVVEKIKSYDAEFAIVVAYGKILPQSLIDAFPKGILNIHYSLLPAYRGASPVETALLNGDTTTGVAIQQMVRELDAGDVIAVQEVEIEPEETTRELRPRLVTIGALLLAGTLPDFIKGKCNYTPQDPGAVTTSAKISKEQGELNLTDEGEVNWNKYRAYAESPGTYFFIHKGDRDVRVKIKTAQYKNGVFTPLRVIPEGKNETDFSTFSL